MKRLAEIMPKEAIDPALTLNSMKSLRIHHRPIRQSAEAFASWMGDELPANYEELRAMLWTFGEILNGNMERMLNDSHDRVMDLLRTTAIPTTILDLSDADDYLRQKDKP
jgi:hypothetical protein